MAIPADKLKDQPKGHTWRRFKDGDNKWRSWQEKIFIADESDKCPTYVHKTPPCQAGCPSGEDIRGWLNIVRGIEKPPKDVPWQEYAFRRLTDANPFPAVMGRVCPAPCQTACNRNAVEEYVGINAVEGFIGDRALRDKLTFQPATQSTGKKVAIIGGGPAGLAAAYQLRRKGHATTIFEAQPELGGMMRYGIPGYRMPRDVLDGEINRILAMGVEVKTGTRVGVDIRLEQLEKEYDAILIAIGAQAGRAIPVPGSEAPNCVTGVAFLEAYNKGWLRHVPKKVVVIGGGDTSIDVVSVSRRLGVKPGAPQSERAEHVIAGKTKHAEYGTEPADVLLVSRQPFDKMNASKHEVEDALREGVKFQNCLQPFEVVLGPDGRGRALKVVELDYSKGKPEPKPGTEREIEFDLLVSAIGQAGDLRGMEAFDNGKTLINADRHYQVPNKPGYFVCGDIVRPHLLTTAIGQAWVVAETIDRYLKRQELGKRPKVDVHHFDLMAKLKETGLMPSEFRPESGGVRDIDRGLRGTSLQGKAVGGWAIHNYEDRADSEVIQANELFLGHFNYEPRHKRPEHGPDANTVLHDFKERVTQYTEEQAVAEAKRCMSCGLCFECDNCVVFCPQTAVKRVPKNERTMGRYVYTEYDECIGCHICSEVCPTGYIKMGMGDH